MRLVIKPLAEQDIEVIGDYIARDNPARAVCFVGELREQCMRIADNPLGYRSVQNWLRVCDRARMGTT
jgi:toxin ParE1/3/4